MRMFIDPSIRSMGIAIWSNKDWKLKNPPTVTSLIRSKGPDWIDRAFYQITKLHWLSIKYPCKYVYCEMPQFYESHKGMTSNRSGSIHKLCFFVGMIARHYGIKKIRLVTPGNWKGQLPKEVVINRITRILGKKNCRNYKLDIWDAVGIGLWKRGLL